MTANQADAVTERWSGTGGLGLCIVAGTLSGLGATMQAFALNWEASGYGAEIAGLVATLGLLPRVLLMLVGGAVADRYGIRRIMIICDCAMIAALAAGCAVLLLRDPKLSVIIGLAMVGGAISAFYLPAAGGFVRLFVSDDRLPIVMPRVSGVQQIARLIGPALGAVAVVSIGLSGTLVVNLLTYGLVLVVLIIIRPPRQLAARESAAGSAGSQIADGLRRCVRTPGMMPALGSVALVAAGVLPVLYLGVPLLVRERHWGAPAAGWIESAWIVGTLTVTVIMARFGTHRRMGWMIVIGPAVAATGALTIASAPTVVAGIVGSVLMGLGTATFTGHLMPLYLSWTPPELTARFQSLFGIVQAVPMALVNLPYGFLAAALGARAPLYASAALCVGAGALVAMSPRVRSSTRPSPPP